MGLFSSDPRVSKTEFEKVRAHLSTKGWSREKINRVEDVFRGDLMESGSDEGISKKELGTGIDWLRESKSKHRFTDEDINEIERSLRERL